MKMNRSQQFTGLTAQAPSSVSVYSKPMNKIMGYIHDWRHERRIALAGRAYDKARHGMAPTIVLVGLWNAYVDCINARSPDQVARMERRMGLR